MGDFIQNLFLTIQHAIDRHGYMKDTKDQPLAATITKDIMAKFVVQTLEQGRNEQLANKHD